MKSLLHAIFEFKFLNLNSKGTGSCQAPAHQIPDFVIFLYDVLQAKFFFSF